uniref:DUF19 domain-containing protein n=1 Tax=Strigamia maritima TaxID=126957 RepID=T1J9M9_STRMM
MQKLLLLPPDLSFDLFALAQQQPIQQPVTQPPQIQQFQQPQIQQQFQQPQNLQPFQQPQNPQQFQQPQNSPQFQQFQQPQNQQQFQQPQNQPFQQPQQQQQQQQFGICERDMKRCIEPLQEFTNTKFATTAEQLQKVCPAMQDNLHCVDEFATHCVPMTERAAILSLYQGIRKIINGLCTEGQFRQEYLRYAPCLWEDQNEYDKCAVHYSNKVKQAESVGYADDEITKQVCCAFHNLVDCSKKIYLLKCGAETAQYMEKYLDLIAGPVIKQSCAPYQYVAMCSTASTFSYNSVILNIVLLLIITVKNLYKC